MSAYDIALFVHLVGVVTLFVAFGIMQLGGARVRQAESLEHVRLWLGLLKTAPAMFPTAFVLILGAGLYMTVDVWTFATPWVVVALVGVGIMIVVGVGIIGRGLNRMGGAASAAPEGPLPPELRALIADPAIWISVFALNGTAIGILWLMATKPGWTASVAVAVALALIGAGLGYVSLRRGSRRRGQS